MGGTTYTLRPSPNLLLYYFGLGGLLSGFLLCFISIHQYYVITKPSVDRSLTQSTTVHYRTDIPQGGIVHKRNHIDLISVMMCISSLRAKMLGREPNSLSQEAMCNDIDK